MNLGPLMVDLQGLELQPDEREMLAHPLVGSVILFARNYADPEQLTRLVADIHAVRSPALIVGVDQEGGRVQRFRDGFSLLPPLRRIGHEFDSEPKAGLALARELGWLMAAELRAHGVDLSFAPCVDLDYGVSEVIGDRALHARAAVVGQLAVAYMHGMRDAGMAATAKHFPGHGAVVADSHHALPVDRRTLVDMDADLAPYRLLIQNGLPGVMVAHVAYPAVEDVPASTSSRWIRGCCAARCISRVWCSPTTCRWPVRLRSVASSNGPASRWPPAAMCCRSAITVRACWRCSMACSTGRIRPRRCGWCGCAARVSTAAMSCSLRRPGGTAGRRWSAA